MKDEAGFFDHRLPRSPELGDDLRSARIFRGLSIKDIQDETKIPRHYLKAIEDGDFASLPGGFFTRSYIRKYAKAVGFSSEHIEDFFATLSKRRNPAPSPSPPITAKQSTVAQKKRPPQFAEYLLYFFLTQSERVNVIGDTEEEYNEVHDRFGRRKANAWYYKQVFDSLYPLIRRSLTKLGFVVGLAKHADKISDFFHRHVK